MNIAVITFYILNFKIYLMNFEKDLVNSWLKNIKNLDNKNHLKHGEIYAVMAVFRILKSMIM